ncbi:AmmeMemoRadiSam system protein B [Magnetospirillum sp. UT-4]|uniref:AmmeMemoRadiSam system protein B n=1 Tax=Magnetospirillum sp. UT-4 TaxID=2681467 RepID=UPI001385323E|nr:AmmeMemoRadiSam system protein B [Magnetospirillum sp. UT-4]CAA7614669.1 MEMO1 family protein MGR_2676 [Magnetospirillum sp. UT-4]
MTAIRPTAVAGMFYPADAGELMRQLEACLAPARARRAADAAPPKALIAPHAGYVYSGPVAASAYALLEPARGRIARVVLMGPSHRVPFRGIAVSGAEAWASPLGTVPVDRETCERLKALPMVGELDKAHAQEHSLEVHVPFLQAVLGAFALVPLVAGEVPREVVAAVLEAAWGGPETLIVISTDLSHYLDYDSCRATDAATVAAIQALDPGPLSGSQACGRIPVGGMLDLARRRHLRIETLDVRNSGDTAGPKDRVVGYGAWALYEPEAADAADPVQALAPKLLSLARASIESGLAAGRPAPADPTLPQPGAVFVTLKRNGQLRGCIGSPTAWRSLGEDVVDNAFKAAFKDPRFPPLRPEEWEGLTLSVSLLTPPVAMAFRDEADLLAQLRPGVDGLIIEDAGRRALFLPSVWEQLPERRQFLAHLKAKAGMAVDHFSATFKASRFEAVEMKSP